MGYEILLVDDEPVNLMFLEIFLKEYFPNEKIYCASNPNDALEIFRTKRINIALLDMHYGGQNMSGLELFDKFKLINDDFKAIAITRYDSKFGYKCGRLGFDDFMTKPFSPEKLRQSISFQIKAIENGTKGNVFCIMPFSDELYDTYLFGIKETLNTIGFNCFRIDERIFNDSIIEKIKESIMTSDYLIADLTNSNPNVFYEVGYAHALGKNVILIANSSADLKFDLQHMRTIIYDGKINKLRDELEKEFKNK
jgi:CheY-like chemotaxis protein